MSESGSEIPQDIMIQEQQPPVESGSVLRQTMEIQLQNADRIENSPEEYQRESFVRAMGKIKEVELYVEQEVITREEAMEILAGQWSQTEIEGLIDPITYTLNKRGFDERLKSALAHGSRTDEPVTVAYLDLKGFKGVNDSIGHAAGDKVLLYVADFLRMNATQRADDFISRIGGDEFVIGFPLGEEDALRQKINAEMLNELLPQYIRTRMEQDGISHNNTVVSARVGLSSALPDDTAESIKHRADVEMNAQRDSNEPSGR